VTSIDFYFNAEDRLQVACRLAGKALKQNQRLLIYAPDAETASRIDRMLWTWPAIGCPRRSTPRRRRNVGADSPAKTLRRVAR
jgi:hypothetical protein